MLTLKNFRHWKTSLLGIILIGSSLAYLFLLEDHDIIIFFGVLALGISFIFLPDNLIGGIKSFINKNKDKEI